MPLTKKQKKYLKKHLKDKPLAEIASQLNISIGDLEDYLKTRWRKEKYQKFMVHKNEPEPDLQERITSFNFRQWLNKNLTVLFFLTLLVFIAYFNSLNNEFLSDDIPAILENQNLNKLESVWLARPTLLRPAIYFIVINLFGKVPIFFRLVNIFFHLGTVLITYLLTDLTLGFRIALFAAAILAVHPLQIEAVSWISGGSYAQYSFFLIFALLTFIFSLKHKKYYYFCLISFLLGLMSSEKAMVFPFILLTLIIALKDIKSWKKLIPFFIIGGLWILSYILKVSYRITALQTEHYQEPLTLNPLIQVPIAITSYLQLIFFPKGLTLYHSEMYFTSTEFIARAVVFLLYLGTIFYGFLKNRYLFFWLSFLLISLGPTLTPFAISWLVAERYVYLGAIGIYVSVGFVLAKLSELRGWKVPIYILWAIMIFSLTILTICRNIDWKNEDNLWLAAAKTSPSSSQNHNNLGDMYGRHGDFNKAAEEFKRAIELKPNYADAYHNLGNAYYQMGNFAEAVKNYKNAIKFNPKLWQSYQNLSAIYLNQKKYDLAIEELSQAIKINPNDDVLHVNMAYIYIQNNQREKAIEEFKQALIINPKNEQAKLNLEKISSD